VVTLAATPVAIPTKVATLAAETAATAKETAAVMAPATKAAAMDLGRATVARKRSNPFSDLLDPVRRRMRSS
jgi:hypothetical protein